LFELSPSDLAAAGSHSLYPWDRRAHARSHDWDEDAGRWSSLSAKFSAARKMTRGENA